MRPTIRQLEYLVAVADHLNFRKAAAAAHVSQPGLSAQIKQLEQLLGVRLFERDRRRVMATEAGREAAERARLILAGVDDLGEAARGYDTPLGGSLRLGVIPSVAPYILPRVLPGVRKRHPGLQLLLREDTTERLVERLGTGDLDVLLLALEAPLGDHHRHPLFEDPFVLAAPSTHRLAARRRVREEDLDAEEVLLLEDGH